MAAAAPEGTKIYHLNFPKPAAYPYIVYELREVSSVDGKTSYALELDCVDKDRDTKNIVDIADSIQDALDHAVLNAEKVFFHCYRARRYSVTEDDKEIRRIHLQLDLYFYTKED